ncbi:hypothetical protein [Aliidiomarina quisquiliarum]|uniref:hypothetical protein n=1 Tax=Aliidiomarina quisquiliarum TaxID=2938947 RepID=UPI00208FB531|nr:hypothetical protein [Aliidiomarina quisquiliarum]MCO4320364.1 hypothetical protein [Aliidiomarina quisquiliarum]
MKVVTLIFLVLIVSMSPARASDSIEYKQSVDISNQTLEQAMIAAQERALEYGMHELPALILGREQVTNGAYTSRIESWRLAGLRHEFTHTSINHTENVVEFTSVIHYDKAAVIEAIVKVAATQRSAREAGQIYDAVREVDSQMLSEHFLRRARAGYESAMAEEFASNDERLINTRLAQERVLAEVMKDVYLHYFVPAIQAMRVANVTREVLANNRQSNVIQIAYRYTPRLPPVENSMTNPEGLITWHEEISAILKPYSEQYPFINIDTIIERMSICSPFGEIYTGTQRRAPVRGMRDVGWGRGQKYSYHTNIASIRPAYNPDTMRREQAQIEISPYTESAVASWNKMSGGELIGVCIH